MICKCGNKTKTKDGICYECKRKIFLLKQIRELVYGSEKHSKKKKTKKKVVRNVNTDRYNFSKHSNICWNCKKASGGCSWSKDFIAVDGWKANPTKILFFTTVENGNRKKNYIDSFDIYECPEFELLDMLL